ncbi:hypothetical protein C5167_032163 [Papaver somniferum]|uniref:Uncharacterized protein n=1 Tax=Papaver somniferum TaxID=3469 RepID=A0A4Y7K9P2_PAPSO|nr:hypothetical protein C5167_032163 [Papaver somniferum]
MADYKPKLMHSQMRGNRTLEVKGGKTRGFDAIDATLERDSDCIA